MCLVSALLSLPHCAPAAFSSFLIFPICPHSVPFTRCFFSCNLKCECKWIHQSINPSIHGFTCHTQLFLHFHARVKVASTAAARHCGITLSVFFSCNVGRTSVSYDEGDKIEALKLFIYMARSYQGCCSDTVPPARSFDSVKKTS